MTVQQLSVFIENKAGTLLKVLELLKEAKIQLIASTIADTVEYGIYRIICSEPMRAYNTLKEANISVALSDVFARMQLRFSVMPKSVLPICILSCWEIKAS